MSQSERWTLWIADPAYGWHVHRGEYFTEAMKVRTVEVMPVAEHEAEIARIHAEYTLIPKHAQAGESIPLEDA